MTTPSQNINSTLTSVGTTRRDRFYSNGTVVHLPQNNVPTASVCTRNIRPASGSSPVRADGSRAPRAWDRRWGNLSCPVREVEFFSSIGSDPWYRNYHRRSLLTTAGNGIDTLLESCGASWSRVSSTGSFPSGVESQARSKFRKELQDGKAEWGVTLGEMKETAKGIRQFSEETLDAISYLAKTARRAKREVVKEVLGIKPGTRKAPPWLKRPDQKLINGWLEYQFSVKPLLGDIQSSGKALSDLLFEENRPMRMKIKVGASDRLVTRYSSPGPISPGWRGSIDAETRTSCHISAVYDVTPTSARTMDQLGLGNPAAVAWELTTLSWMVDYVWGVGDWLNSLTRIEGATFVEGSLTRVQRCSIEGPVAFNPTNGSIALLKGFDDYELTFNAGRMQRIVLSDVAPGQLPAFRSRLGLTQMANSLAVLSKLLR